MRVIVPSQLRSYTDGKSEVEAAGETVDAVLCDLDAHFPGIRFRVVDEQGRIRQHMRVFLSGDRVRDIGEATASHTELFIFGALTGG